MTDSDRPMGLQIDCSFQVLVGRHVYHAQATADGFQVAVGDAGTLIVTDTTTQLSSALTQIRRRWRYQGEIVDLVRLMNQFRTPNFAPTPDYYTYAGVIWNGNRFGVAEHAFGEHKREERFCVPSCLTLEKDGVVLGVWTAPQRDLTDLISSGALRYEGASRQHVIEIALPFLDEIGVHDLFDDTRMTLTDGMELWRDFYVYTDWLKPLPGAVDGRLNGFGQVISAAWDVLYPDADTKPEMSLAQLQDAKMQALSRTPNEGLLRTYQYNGKEYTIHYVAKHFDGTNDIIHPYVGFTWSGAQALVAYNLLIYAAQTNQPHVGGYAESALDFFTENGRSECGLLYPVFFTADSDFPWPDVGSEPAWGTYLNNVGQVDMYPLGEGLYWILRAYQLDPDRYGRWRDTVADVCQHIMALWPDADIPARVNGTTGVAVLPSVADDGLTNASYLLWPFMQLYAISGDAVYRDYAARLAEQVLAFALRHEIYWKAEPDAHGLDKRAGFGAMRGFMMLYEATNDDHWLGAAIRASNWMKSWQWTYNAHFEPDTALGKFDYRTIGATSTRIDHDSLQYAYAALANGWCRLWEHTGDHQLLERARTLLHQGTQWLLDQEHVDWLNERYFTKVKLTRPDFLGAHFENVFQITMKRIGSRASRKGALQIVPGALPFYAIFGLAMPLEWSDIVERYGGVVWSALWQNGEALEAVRLINGQQDAAGVTLEIENMMTQPVTFPVRILHLPAGAYRLDGEAAPDLAAGWSVTLAPGGRRAFRVDWSA